MSFRGLGKSLKRGKSKTIRLSLEDYAADIAQSFHAPSTVDESALTSAINNSIMGAAGSLPPSPLAQYNSSWAQAQQSLQNQLGQYVNQGLNYQAAVSLSGLDTKVQRKISQAIDQLPMSLCARIVAIQFRHADETHPMRFVVIFTNNHTIEFLDVDGFPADEHIARIALECP